MLATTGGLSAPPNRPKPRLVVSNDKVWSDSMYPEPEVKKSALLLWVSIILLPALMFWTPVIWYFWPQLSKLLHQVFQLLR